MIKRQELYQVLQGINEAANLTGIRFAYALKKNKDKILGELKLAESFLEKNDEFKAYDVDRLATINEFGKKGENGEVLISNGNYEIADKEGFDAAIEIINEKHKKAIEDNQKKMAEYRDFMDEEIDFPFHFIEMSNVPEGITVGIMDKIMPLIKE